MKTPLMLFASAAMGFGCATPRPPDELLAARTRYEEARNGETARLNPAGLYEAQKAIDAASQSFDERGADLHTRDLSYIALRKVQLAEIDSQVASAEQSKELAKNKSDGALETWQDATGQSAVTPPGPRPEVAVRDADDRGREHRRQQKQYEAERQAQQDALEQVAQVSRDQRGTVVTLTGAALFISGEAGLTPGGKERLNDVARALLQARSGGFIIEGHTDTLGSAANNDDLSMRRAESVRLYLISRGVPGDDVRAVGMGQRNPIADNKTPDGRAANRRVEIVIQPPTGVAAQ
jgi:outer membrane protein OmpA-like peptidoglycan-associated protein